MVDAHIAVSDVRPTDFEYAGKSVGGIFWEVRRKRALSSGACNFSSSDQESQACMTRHQVF